MRGGATFQTSFGQGDDGNVIARDQPFTESTSG